MDILFSLINQKILQNNIKILNKDILKLISNYSYDNYQKYIKFNNNHYNKIIINQNDLIQLCIITWLPNQFSTIHNHSDGGCILHILHNNLSEIRFNHTKSKSFINNLNTNQTSLITNFDQYPYHQIINNNNYYSVSIHLYKIK